MGLCTPEMDFVPAALASEASVQTRGWGTPTAAQGEGNHHVPLTEKEHIGAAAALPNPRRPSRPQVFSSDRKNCT